MANKYLNKTGLEVLVQKLTEKMDNIAISSNIHLVSVEMELAELFPLLSGNSVTVELPEGSFNEALANLQLNKYIDVIFIIAQAQIAIKVPMLSLNSGMMTGLSSFEADLTQSGTSSIVNIIVDFKPNDTLVVKYIPAENLGSGSSVSNLVWIDGSIDIDNVSASVSPGAYSTISSAMLSRKDVKLRMITEDGGSYMILTLQNIDLVGNTVAFSLNFAIGNISIVITVIINASDTCDVYVTLK